MPKSKDSLWFEWFNLDHKDQRVRHWMHRLISFNCKIERLQCYSFPNLFSGFSDFKGRRVPAWTRWKAGSRRGWVAVQLQGSTQMETSFAHLRSPESVGETWRGKENTTGTRLRVTTAIQLMLFLLQRHRLNCVMSAVWFWWWREI